VIDYDVYLILNLSQLNLFFLIYHLCQQDQWSEMFSSMIASAATVEVLSSGTGGTRSGALQVVCFSDVCMVLLYLATTNYGMLFRCLLRFNCFLH